MRPNRSKLSLLLALPDEPGSLESALHIFSRHGVNLTHIESRPARDDVFDIYVDCEGRRGEPDIELVLSDLLQTGTRLLVLDDKVVPWFPRHVSELGIVRGHTLQAGSDLDADHPGFSDTAYRERRARIASLAEGYHYGRALSRVAYIPVEVETWSQVYRGLRKLHERFACRELCQIMSEMEQSCGYGESSIPDFYEVSSFLTDRTGFRLWPVAGLISSRDFLAGLAFRVFFSTQYIRHHSRPLYTPEPDVCHELIGHVPMFADAAFADLSQEIGLASLGASDEEINHLARCYWFSVEFGLLREHGELKAYGAGLLSSPGELAYACNAESSAELRPWEPNKAADQEFPITEYQPVYYVAASLQDARSRMRAYCVERPRPFYARYNGATETIWVDRALRRS